MRKNTWFVVMLALLLPAGGAAAQPGVEIEVGAGYLDLNSPYLDDTFTTTGYIGGSVVFADRVAVYGAIHPDGDGIVRAGVEWRLGPAAWLVRPAVRAGVCCAEPALGTVGFGLHVGRRVGGRFTVDWTNRREEYGSHMFLHLGAFYAF